MNSVMVQTKCQIKEQVKEQIEGQVFNCVYWDVYDKLSLNAIDELPWRIYWAVKNQIKDELNE